MGFNQISHELLEHGFTMVLGTIEYPAMTPRFVCKGEPLRFDINNGMCVVYDEKGRPWISGMENPDFKVSQERPEWKPQGEPMLSEFQAMIQRHKVERGAYVPHSNDGGYYRCNVLNALASGVKNIAVPDFRVKKQAEDSSVQTDWECGACKKNGTVRHPLSATHEDRVELVDQQHTHVSPSCQALPSWRPLYR